MALSNDPRSRYEATNCDRNGIQQFVIRQPGEMDEHPVGDHPKHGYIARWHGSLHCDDENRSNRVGASMTATLRFPEKPALTLAAEPPVCWRIFHVFVHSVSGGGSATMVTVVS